MKNKKLNFKFKKVLLIMTITLESLVMIYLLNTVLSGNIIKYKPMVVNMPNISLNFSKDISDLRYFHQLNPNEYWIEDNNFIRNFSGIIVYSTNSDGLRDRYNYSKEKPNNVFRIAIFGDSNVYGLNCCNVTDVLTEILEDSLNSLNCSKKIEVINFGVPGYDFPFMAELFRQKGKYYNSDINIFMISDDDIDFNANLWMPIEAEYYRPEEFLNISDEQKFFKGLEITDKIIEKYVSIKNNISSDLWLKEQVIKPFDIISNGTSLENRNIIFTYFMGKNYNEFLKNLTKDYNFIFVSLDDLDKNYGTIWAEKYAVIPNVEHHPNKLGHQFYATVLYSYLISNNLIEC